MPAYEGQRFDPPAAMARVDVRDPEIGSALTAVEMLIDSGVDVTVVPRTVVKQLGAKPVEGQPVEVVGFDGTRSSGPGVVLEMRFLGRVFRGRFLMAPLETGGLGRNVLNARCPALNGPRLAWTMASSAGQPPR